MTSEQFKRAKEIERELANIQSMWYRINDPGCTITNSDGSPCDRVETLKGLHREFSKRIDQLKKEFKEL